VVLAAVDGQAVGLIAIADAVRPTSAAAVTALKTPGPRSSAVRHPRLPIAVGVFEPVIGWVLRPEIGALSTSGFRFLAAMNALLLKRLKLPASISPVPAAAASAGNAGESAGLA